MRSRGAVLASRTWQATLALLLAVGAVWSVAAAGEPPTADTLAHVVEDPRVRAMMDQVQTDDLVFHLTALSGERETAIGGEPYTIATRYAYRAPGGTEGMRKAAQYLMERYAEWDIPAEEWHFSTYGWTNVVATLPGWVHPERVHILCAHYDSISDYPLKRAPGADDNGSGTVALLIAARILGQHAFEDTIRFVHFAGEEEWPGLLGSSAYAHQVAWEGEEIVDVINLDMIAWDGSGDPDLDLNARDEASQEVADTFAEVIQVYGLNLVPERLYGSDALGAGDHYPFWKEGIPAIMAIEDYHPNQHDFSPYYHQTTDLVRKLMPEECPNCLNYFTEFARAALGAVAHRAGLLPEDIPTPTSTPTATATATPACPNHLPDGDFEAGPDASSWTLYSHHGLPLVNQEKPRTGTWGAELGNHIYSRDRISQTVAIPAGATDLTFSYWWYMETDEWHWYSSHTGRPHDPMRVEVLDGDGAPLETLETLSEEYPQGRWNFSTWDLTPYAGQMIQVRFAAENNSWYVTRYFVDDVALHYCLSAEPTPTPTQTPTATATPTATPTERPVHRQHLPLIQRGAWETAR